jgi:GMP synthase-like glutamine amidotransferase
MKPVLVLQHLSGDGPAFLGRWLAEQGADVDVRNAQAGDAYPESLASHGALAILGGEMSANDPLSALRRAEALFLEALREGIPTLGHCLGGQLMARALGARIGPSLAPEVGFNALHLLAGPATEGWFGRTGSARVFQWHYEAFELPVGAEGLATSAACRHQAFSVGPHLGMQFHIELDAEKLERWSRDEGDLYRQAVARHPGTVHDGARMRLDAVALMAAHQALAARIYGRWLTAARSR